jgi:hypothetical protein
MKRLLVTFEAEMVTALAIVAVYRLSHPLPTADGRPKVKVRLASHE